MTIVQKAQLFEVAGGVALNLKELERELACVQIHIAMVIGNQSLIALTIVVCPLMHKYEVLQSDYKGCMCNKQ